MSGCFETGWPSGQADDPVDHWQVEKAGTLQSSGVPGKDIAIGGHHLGAGTITAIDIGGDRIGRQVGDTDQPVGRIIDIALRAIGQRVAIGIVNFETGWPSRQANDPVDHWQVEKAGTLPEAAGSPAGAHY